LKRKRSKKNLGFTHIVGLIRIGSAFTPTVLKKRVHPIEEHPENNPVNSLWPHGIS
jgi:hypothetical protein